MERGLLLNTCDGHTTIIALLLMSSAKMGGGGGGGLISLFKKISCLYHSENMYWVTLNVKINFKEFLTPHNPPVHTP